MQEKIIKQKTFSTESNGKKIIHLHMKDYLQPFEETLAFRELKGLKFDILSYNETLNIVTIKKDSSYSDFTEKLNRLAYFDYYRDEYIHPTLQACREGASINSIPTHSSFPKRRVLRFGSHGFHEFRGKFFPQLVRSLCNYYGLEKGSIIFDPMCGSGTTLVESRALGMVSIGMDTNPLSTLISEVKTTAIDWTIKDITGILKNFKEIAESESVSYPLPWNQKDQVYLENWFDSQALHEISTLLGMLNKLDNDEHRKFGFVCLSDIIRTISYQKLADLRVRKEVHVYSKGNAFNLFRNRFEHSLTTIKQLIQVDPNKNTHFEVKIGDAKNQEDYFNSYIGKVDAIIMSPPYATALPYLDTDRLSLIVLGLLQRSSHKLAESNMIGSREISEKNRMKIWVDYLEKKEELPAVIQELIDKLALKFHTNEVGFRRRNKPALLARYFFDMKEVLLSMKKMLKKESNAFVVVGNNSTHVNGNRVDIPTDEFIEKLAKTVGFNIKPHIDMELLISRDIFKKNRGTRERIIILEKKNE